MSQPDGLMEQDLQLVHYLLGLLPEREADRLDEDSIVDDEVAARLCSVEDDLVDAYVMGTLDQTIREHFEASYLKSPRRRTKVKFARRFLTVVDRASSAPSVPPTAVACSPSNRVHRFPLHLGTSKPDSSVHQSRVRWPFMTAAASFLLACGLLVNDVRLRDGLNQARREGAVQDPRGEVMTRPLDQARNENAHIAEALEGARVGSAEPPSANAPGTTRGATSSGISATVLLPQTRSIGQPPTIRIPVGAGSIRFELRLESNDFTRYQATLKSTSNDIVWRSQPLNSRSNAGSYVSLVVPPSVLESQHYLFELAGVDRNGHETPVSSYAFQLERR
jgi:hypothetical protein